MKKLSIITTTKILFVASSFLMLGGCSKDRIEEEEKTLVQYSSINSYMDLKKQEEQDFIIDSTGTGPIIGNQGTKIWTGKECLMYPNGDSVSWPYSLKLVELYTPKDMIYYQMPTVSAGEIMKTKGEIRIRAFKAGVELVLRPDPCMHQIEMPSTNPESNMHVFNGLTTNNYPDWMDDSPVNLFTATVNSHIVPIHTLGWINCGVLAGGISNSNLSFTSSTDNLDNVGIFIYVPSTKTVMQVYNLSSQNIPNGTDVKIILIGVDGSGNLFSYYQELNVTASSAIDVTLTAISDAALTAVLDGL